MNDSKSNFIGIQKKNKIIFNKVNQPKFAVSK